ncbi:MAG: hypothetical protein JXJ20_00245 [Anaerolineae bacterium]|nr:hypothetical protein [Anaerolineae bacterium]
MITELNRVTVGLLVAFLVVTAGLVYWSVVQADDLLAREDNLRSVIAEQRIQRGAIFDRDGERLAYSQAQANGVMQRIYPYPEASGVVGYYSFTYGAAGLEAAFDEELRGDDLRDDWGRFVDETLHRTQQGSDIRSTVDLDVQRAAAAALGDQSGAVVVVHVPSGRVLAMVSQPGYDPNLVETDWDALTEHEDTSPLLNRVTLGLYQPGGALYTVMLAAILASYPDLDEAGGYVLNGDVPDAQAPVMVNSLTLTCLDRVTDRPLTLAEAYSYGCPGPFAAVLGQTVTPDRLWERFGAVGLLEAPALAGFETVAGDRPDPLTDATPPETLIAAAVGQSDLTVTPLHMVEIAAAIANRGNAVPLHIVDAVRQPGAADWEAIQIPALQPALLREDVAEAVRLTMLQAAALSPTVAQARRQNLVLYGHSALAFGGPDATPYAWFVGFVDQSEGSAVEAVAVVVVIEGEPDAGRAADVAGAAFEAAVYSNME